MTPAPLVTVAVPVYNGAEHLDTCLGDLLAQTFERFEVLVLDNASTDGSAEIAEAVAARDGRVHVVRREANIGGNGNFNDGFARCRTPYFKWAAVDDRHDPAFLERTVALLDAHPEAVFAFTGSDVIDADDRPIPYDPARKAYVVNGKPWYHDFDAETAVLSGDAARRFRALLFSRITGTLVYGLFHTEALRRVPLFGPSRSDVHILSELALHGPFVRADETLFFRRLHEGATWQRTRREIIRFENARVGVMTPPWRAAAQYARAALTAPVSLPTKARCLTAVADYGLRRDAVRDLLVPGPTNYWGLGQPRPAPTS